MALQIRSASLEPSEDAENHANKSRVFRFGRILSGTPIFERAAGIGKLSDDGGGRQWFFIR